jgi:hypothetical protein
MKYEYKTIYTDKTKRADLSEEVSKTLNDLSASGWEYIDNITPGEYGYAILVFRREKK